MACFRDGHTRVLGGTRIKSPGSDGDEAASPAAQAAVDLAEELALSDSLSSLSSSASSDDIVSIPDHCGVSGAYSVSGDSEEGGEYEEFASTGKVVLVTGGAGFIGSHTAEALLERGDKVVVVDEVNDYYDVRVKHSNLARLEARYGSRFTAVIGNICDRELMAATFKEHGVTHVCHLAARAGVRPSIDDPFVYVESNVLGTVTLLEMAGRSGVKNFVYASSSSVYGGSSKETFSEADVVDAPVSPYAATKKACELMAATYHHLYKLNCTGLRFFTVYGPRGRPDMAPFKFIDRIMNGVTIDQYGDGSSSRDYTYIDDIVAGTVLAIDKPLGNAIINLGRGDTCYLRDFISTVEDLCGVKASINVMPKQPGDVDRTCCDITRARELLGYRAQVPLEEGLRRTVEWYKGWLQNEQNDEEEEETQAAHDVRPAALAVTVVGHPIAAC